MGVAEIKKFIFTKLVKEEDKKNEWTKKKLKILPLYY
jgi:hypothetical protein